MCRAVTTLICLAADIKGEGSPDLSQALRDGRGREGRRPGREGGRDGRRPLPGDWMQCLRGRAFAFKGDRVTASDDAASRPASVFLHFLYFSQGPWPEMADPGQRT